MNLERERERERDLEFGTAYSFATIRRGELEVKESWLYGFMCNWLTDSSA